MRFQLGMLACMLAGCAMQPTVLDPSIVLDPGIAMDPGHRGPSAPAVPSGSTLRICDIARSAIVVAAPVTVPATGNGTLAAVAALLALVGLRRLRRTAR